MNHITIDDLKKMTGSEGLILQGCGGDLQEWIDGINGALTEAGILCDGDTFKDVVAFKHEGLINLLFKMDGVNLNVGALAMWRLSTHEKLGGTWLSDYLTNKFGIDFDKTESVDKKVKPDCELIGQDGNIFNLMGIASRTLKANGQAAEAKEMCAQVMQCGSYDEALYKIGEYVNIVGCSDDEDMDMGMGGM